MYFILSYLRFLCLLPHKLHISFLALFTLLQVSLLTYQLSFSVIFTPFFSSALTFNSVTTLKAMTHLYIGCM